MTGFAATRVNNSCVLLEFDHMAVLTDPWFDERWHLRRGERLGLGVADLPELAAILGSHFFPNHWDIGALAAYPHKDRTADITSHPRMTSRARACGFGLVRELGDASALTLGDDLKAEAIRDQGPLGLSSNIYVLSHGGLRVLFGGEARNLATLRAYRAGHPPVDIAFLPVNGLHVPGGPRLVMSAQQAVEAAVTLGATTLIPIHDAHARDLPWFFIRRNGSAEEAQRYAQRRHPALRVEVLEPGVRSELHSRSGG
jgi:L-ascorbate metabolism protein UlaG (beta-lactamase superfamily)